MGCEQLVQHAKVSKNRKFIPHFRENLARPLDKGGVGVVYLPCNPQSAASVREVINTANRLIHRVTAEVINPFQQLSTLYRHVVDTSPPLGRTAAPVYSRATALPSCFSLYRFSVAPKHLCLFPALPRHRFTAAPFHLCTAALLHRSSLRGSAASPLRRFRPLLLENPFLLFVFPFPGCLSPFSRDVCLPGVGSGRLPGGLGNGAPDAAAALRSAPEIPFHILARAIPPPAVESRPLRLSRTGTQDGGAGRRRGKRRRSGRGEEEDMKGEERGKGAVGTLTWRGGATLPGRNSGGPRLGRT